MYRKEAWTLGLNPPAFECQAIIVHKVVGIEAEEIQSQKKKKRKESEARGAQTESHGIECRRPVVFEFSLEQSQERSEHRRTLWGW